MCLIRDENKNDWSAGLISMMSRFGKNIQQILNKFKDAKFCTGFLNFLSSFKHCNQKTKLNAPTFHFLNIQINIIFPSTPWFSKKTLSLKFSHQNFVCISPLTRTCYVPRPYHLSRYNHPNNSWWGVQIIKFLIICQ